MLCDYKVNCSYLTDSTNQEDREPGLGFTFNTGTIASWLLISVTNVQISQSVQYIV